MTWKQRRELAAQHFGLSEADIEEQIRVHGPGHRVFPAYHCYTCDERVTEWEWAKMRQGRLVVVKDEQPDE